MLWPLSHSISGHRGTKKAFLSCRLRLSFKSSQDEHDTLVTDDRKSQDDRAMPVHSLARAYCVSGCPAPEESLSKRPTIT